MLWNQSGKWSKIYLGINLSKGLRELYNENSDTIRINMKETSENTKPAHVLGRINIMKIVPFIKANQ